MYNINKLPEMVNIYIIHCEVIGRVSLARENEAEGSWRQEVHIFPVNV